MASLTHSRKVYERLGPWPFVRGPILNERITHGVWRRFSFKMLSLSHCARSTFKRLPAASRQPSFPIVRSLFPERSLLLHSPLAFLRVPRTNSSFRCRAHGQVNPSIRPCGLRSIARFRVVYRVHDYAFEGKRVCFCAFARCGVNRIVEGDGHETIQDSYLQLPGGRHLRAHRPGDPHVLADRARRHADGVLHGRRHAHQHGRDRLHLGRPCVLSVR